MTKAPSLALGLWLIYQTIFTELIQRTSSGTSPTSLLVHQDSTITRSRATAIGLATSLPTSLNCWFRESIMMAGGDANADDEMTDVEFKESTDPTS
jgi:hypothetical protein